MTWSVTIWNSRCIDFWLYETESGEWKDENEIKPKFPPSTCSDSSFHSDQKQKLIEKLESKFQGPDSLKFSLNKGEPSYEYEKTRRRIENNIDEFWNLVDSEVKKVQKTLKSEPDENNLALSKQLNSFMALANENKRWEIGICVRNSLTNQ